MKAAEVLERTGITYRQLDHWTRKGILPDQSEKGPGSGKQRDFTNDDVEMILRISSMAASLQGLGLMARPTLTPAQRYEAVNDLLKMGVNRYEAVKFLDRWLPIDPTVAA